MEKYKEYVGGKYNYEGKNLTIQEIKIVGGKFVVKTDIRTFVFYETDIDNFISDLKDFKLIEAFKMKKENKEIVKKTNNDSDKIKNILFDTIEKVIENKEYVRQANAICNVTSQLINIKKIELRSKSK